MNKNLYLFTARFPFSTVENFLEDEIVYLCRQFKHVYIIPFMYEGDERGCPANCSILEPVVRGKMDYVVHGCFSIKTFRLLARDFFKNRVFLSTKKLRVWFTGYIAINCYLNSLIVYNVGKNIEKSDVVYFYWGKWGNILSCFWKNRCSFISRFHGEWDLWEEKYDGYAPLRSYVAQSLDAAVFISQKGERYFYKRYPFCKTRVFRLGTKDIGLVDPSSDGIIRILSCSSIYPLKRVDLILKSVVEVSKNSRVEWTHLGGGVDYEKISKIANSIQTDYLKVNMPGQVSYDDVLNYYKKSNVDVFLNLSTNEGIPVSVMEAISCNIPVVATDVGGTSEVVVEKSGILVSANPSPKDVSEAIMITIAERDRFAPRELWKEMYQAENNYLEFAKFLKTLDKYE